MLFLDIDYGISIEDFVALSEDYNLYPNLIYTSYRNSRKHPRFHVVYMLDRIIYNRRVYKYLLKGLGNIFPSVDPKCLEPSRVYYGTIAGEIVDLVKGTTIKTNEVYRSLFPDSFSADQSVQIYSHQPIGYDHVKTVIDSSYYVPFDTNSNHSRAICKEDPAEVTCAYFRKEDDTNKGHYTKNEIISSVKSKCDVKWENLLYINRSSHSTSLFPVSKTPEGIQRVEKVNFDDLAKRSEMFGEFVSGEIWEKTRYRHIFNLAYNLKWVKGGLSYMLKVMKRNNEKSITEYTDNEFSCVKLARSYEYYPPSLYEMKDLYPEDYNRWGNIYNAVINKKRGSVEINEENLPKAIQISEGEALLKKNVQ